MFEKIVEIGLLFDYYGGLLSEKQYMTIELYYIHDLSLSEIGEQLNISRQGVYDTLKRAENHLYLYEDKLGLVKKFDINRDKIKEILRYTNKITDEINIEEISRIKEYANNIQRIALDIVEG